VTKGKEGGIYKERKNDKRGVRQEVKLWSEGGAPSQEEKKKVFGGTIKKKTTDSQE